jgi:hypothetical protein
VILSSRVERLFFLVFQGKNFRFCFIFSILNGRFLQCFHPWMPQGNSAIMSYNLPIPNSNVSNLWSVVNAVDYTGINWPVTQFEYETSSYWYGGFAAYAPAWSGSITGISA